MRKVQDLEALLGVLVCPRCQLRLRVARGVAPSEVLFCTGCGERYPVVDGIPVLLSAEARQTVDPTGGSVWDRVSRGQLVDTARMRARLSRHHFVRVMEREARRFAAALPADGWLVDLGAGWTWPWRPVRHPRVLAIDVSLDSLRLARCWLTRDPNRGPTYFVCAGAERLPLAPASVHGVWSAQMLQHLRPAVLECALSAARRSLVAGGSFIVFWVNWSLPLRLLARVFPDRVKRTLDGASYYRRVSGRELVRILAPHFGTPVHIRYNELLFQPDFGVTHDLPIAWLDRALAAVPGINAAIARQVVATVTVPQDGRSVEQSSVA